MLADPADAARLSAVALATRAGVSQASVTRFAQSIGLASHAELRLALAEQKGRSTAPGVPMDVGVDIHPDDSVRQVVKVVANADVRAITQTVNQLDHQALDLASRAIAVARRVDVYGIGSSASVAYELETRLFRVGVMVRAWTEVHEALTSASLLTADDVAIAISHSGATSEVVEPFRLAADRGAVTIGLTGDPRSAVAAASRHVLTTAALETSYRNGSLAARHSQMMIADCLYIRVVQLTPDRAAESMALTEHISPSHAVTRTPQPSALAVHRLRRADRDASIRANTAGSTVTPRCRRASAAAPATPSATLTTGPAPPWRRNEVSTAAATVAWWSRTLPPSTSGPSIPASSTVPRVRARACEAPSTMATAAASSPTVNATGANRASCTGRMP